MACTVSYSAPQNICNKHSDYTPPKASSKKRCDVSNFDPFCGQQRKTRKKRKSSAQRERFCVFFFSSSYLLNNFAYRWVANGKAKHHQCSQTCGGGRRNSQRLVLRVAPPSMVHQGSCHSRLPLFGAQCNARCSYVRHHCWLNFLSKIRKDFERFWDKKVQQKFPHSYYLEPPSSSIFLYSV